MTIRDLKPTVLWKYFDEITQIPRPSKKEEKIIKYLLDFAKEHNLKVKQDRIGNIVISKKATPGKENLPTVILQSHVDMVCEKNSDVEHDFDNDPIQTYIDGDWLKAKGTTLGADNGVGVAAELAVLASKDIAHGNIECLFTLDEETGLTGAFALGKNLFSGSILLNLDTEEEGEIYIGCSGGKGAKGQFKYKTEETPKGHYWFKLQVKGLRGGHSGSDIDKGLGNANKIIARYIHSLSKRKFKLAVSEIDGGNLHNAVAREAYAIIGVDKSTKEEATILANTLLANIKNELGDIEPNVDIIMETAETPTNCIDKKTIKKLTLALISCPHGVLGMSNDIEGLVETSANMASIKMKEKHIIEVTVSVRSSIESSKFYALDMVSSVFTLAGAKVIFNDGYPGWKPNPKSEILQVAKKTYFDLYNVQPEIKAIHAGLECGLFLEKYPHLDMISIGPTMRDVHSPDEKIEIPSVLKWWDFFVKLLENIPASADKK